MQSLAVTSTTGYYHGASNAAAYSAAQVTSLINAHGGAKIITFRFDLLTKTLAYKGDITSLVVSAQRNHDTTQPVHGTLRLMMAETAASQTITVQNGVITEAGIDYNNDLVQPWCAIGVPGTGPFSGGTGEWLLFPLGVFMFTQPAVTMAGYALERDAQMSDLTYIVSRAQVVSNSVGAPFIMPSQTKLIDIVYHLLTNAPDAAGTGVPYEIPVGTPTLTTIPGLGIPTSRIGSALHPWPSSTTVDAITGGDALAGSNYTFSEGTDYLTMINQMLFWCSCENLWCDENGQYCTDVRPFTGDYSGQSIKYTYDSTVDSIIDFGGSETFDLSQMFNVVQVVVEDPSRDTFYAGASNTSASSPLSLANKGYAIVNTIHDSGVPTATGTNWAQNYANIMLKEATFLTDQVVLPTSVNPAHQNKDVIALNIYQSFVADGSDENWPIIVGASTPNTTVQFPVPGLVVTEKFVEVGWSISIQNALPNAAKVSGASGLTAALEPQHSKQGHTMQHTLARVTSLG